MIHARCCHSDPYCPLNISGILVSLHFPPFDASNGWGSTVTKKEAQPNKIKNLNSTKIHNSTTPSRTYLKKKNIPGVNLYRFVPRIFVIAVVVEALLGVGSKVVVPKSASFLEGEDTGHSLSLKRRDVNYISQSM